MSDRREMIYAGRTSHYATDRPARDGFGTELATLCGIRPDDWQRAAAVYCEECRVIVFLDGLREILHQRRAAQQSPPTLITLGRDARAALLRSRTYAGLTVAALMPRPPAVFDMPAVFGVQFVCDRSAAGYGWQVSAGPDVIKEGEI